MEKLLEFLKYIKANHVTDVAKDSLKYSREMNLPMLKFFSNIPDEVLLAQSEKGIHDFVDSIVDGTYMKKQLDGLKQWEEDKLPGISKNSIEPTDLVLIYMIQKQAYFKYIPAYTKDSQLAIDIVMEMEHLHLASQLEAVKLLFKLRKKIEEDLETSNKELEAFSYSVSHDLRAPLRAIHGFTKILEEDYAGKLDPEGLDIMNTIVSNTEKMGMLIDDLLAFSRLGRKDLQAQKLNMTQLAKDAVAEVTNNVKDFAGDIVVNQLPPVVADQRLMSQVFVNLISNAVKYSGKTKTPHIEITSSQNNGDYIYCVKDNGVGFDMKYYDKLFGVFQRLHNNSDFEGTGIGLALVKRIISRHGGNIWAEGEPDKGASFYFSLKSLT